jgi:ribose-phosphate pyrophosphokinase
MIIIPGPASQELGKEIAKQLKARISPIEFTRFPDGESRIRFECNIEDDDVVIVQTAGPPQNENLIHLFLMADNAKDLKAKTVTAVVPYFAYARQDQRFRPGEVFSLKTIVTLLKTCGVKRILTVNSHNPAILKTMPIRIRDLSAIPLLAEYYKNKGFSPAVSLSLGKKGLDTAIEANNVLKGGYNYIPTQRDRTTGTVTLEKKTLPIKGKDVVIFDDIVSSGGTMIKAVAYAKGQGAKTVNVACVHALLTEEVKSKILSAGADQIVATDSVQSPISVVSIAPLIAEALAKKEAQKRG